ncbi:hypothetical protein BC941DRAFT_508186 [Chlamydoabsidia padenii]|nr:hypothetical protein BC941DRAFT_508186 [Chlamydoabsidia padenii]
MLIDGKKVACATCIKGHRATHCKHKDRPMVEIKKKGRPATQCPRCRELRVVRQLHVKCSCYAEKELKRASTMNGKHKGQYPQIIKKLVIDISKSNLRAIAPRPNQQLGNDSSDFSPTTSLPPPSTFTNLSIVTPSSPALLSPQHNLAYSTKTITPPPGIINSKSCCSPSTKPSLQTTTLSPASKCSCRPGNSCGCSKTGMCCGSLTKKPPSTSSSCCGSSPKIPTASPPPSSSLCCGSSSTSRSAESTIALSCGSTSSLTSTQSIDNPTPTSSSITTTGSTCCRNTVTTDRSSTLSPQCMLEPFTSSPTLPPIDPPKPTTKPTMCADGYGKSSCCSSKQRNSLGETIRLVTCRCGDSCACIGCDAHPSRAMKSSQQDPYAGYTDISLGRRRLSIAAICSTTDSTPSSPSLSSPSSSPKQSSSPQQNWVSSSSSSSSLSSKIIDDMPTSVLAENGSLLCGCGCSNTLNECTDCFQELCQDYYAGR